MQIQLCGQLATAVDCGPVPCHSCAALSARHLPCPPTPIQAPAPSHLPLRGCCAAVGLRHAATAALLDDFECQGTQLANVSFEGLVVRPAGAKKKIYEPAECRLGCH